MQCKILKCYDFTQKRIGCKLLCYYKIRQPEIN
nr:MAG TPA: hypothetical protein [Caudoviricetes sp.]